MLATHELHSRLDQLVRAKGRSPEEQQRDLEKSLTPMVRLALRKGIGIPALVHWVRSTYLRLSPNPHLGAPEQYAPQITRLLSATLLQPADVSEAPPTRRIASLPW